MIIMLEALGIHWVRVDDNVGGITVFNATTSISKETADTAIDQEEATKLRRLSLLSSNNQQQLLNEGDG